MARRKTKADPELARIHARAQDGVHDLMTQLRNARRVLGDLLRPEGRHKHSEPYEPYGAEICGWCSNIRHWRATETFLVVTLPHARRLQDHVRELARKQSQTALWETVKDIYPHMRRDLVRKIWQGERRS